MSIKEAMCGLPVVGAGGVVPTEAHSWYQQLWAVSDSSLRMRQDAAFGDDSED